MLGSGGFEAVPGKSTLCWIGVVTSGLSIPGGSCRAAGGIGNSLEPVAAPVAAVPSGS